MAIQQQLEFRVSAASCRRGCAPSPGRAPVSSARELLAQAAPVLRRALSADSREYLSANAQTSGE